MNFIQAHWGAIVLGLWIMGTALNRAIPAEASDFKWGQFFIDWIKGILGMLPSAAPKLTAKQKATLKA
jgi:hypothetical protein